jgi:hypothetical protein
MANLANHWVPPCIIIDVKCGYHINSKQAHRGHLGFSPHKTPMPQISSMDRLLMAARDINDSLKHPHPDVPFATIGDATITALTTLAAILKNKLKSI